MPSGTPVWYCCNCNYGPLNDVLDYSCPSCQQMRCKYCSTATIAQHYCLQPPEMPINSPYPDAPVASIYASNTYKPDRQTKEMASKWPLNMPPAPDYRARLSLTAASISMPPTLIDCGHLASMDAPPSQDIFRHGGLTKQPPQSYSYYCCQCNDGPITFENHPACVSCSHIACKYCRLA